MGARAVAFVVGLVLFVGLGVGAMGCSGGDIGYAVRLDLRVDASVSDSALSRARMLDLAVSGSVESWYQRVPLSGQLGGRSAALVYRPHALGGHLDFSLRLRDASDAELGEGSASVELAPGATVDAAVLIAVAGMPDFAVIPDMAGIIPDLATPPDLSTQPPLRDMAKVTPPDLAQITPPDLAQAMPTDLAMGQTD